MMRDALVNSLESRSSDMAVKSAPAEAATPPVAPTPTETPRPSAVQWNDKNMATHFANVVNVQSTREQVDLFFGTNQTWNVTDGAAVSVDLTNRIILTPFAAKRLLTVLGGVLREYESRHGSLQV
jgi:Protein of unknown function (DUF3467)